MKVKINPNETTPHYITKRGKLLWIDNRHYNAYSSAANCKILVGADGRFWGYSDNPNLRKE
ncbi:hypothetical protein ES705_16780 [subsurface metagenome]